MHRKRDSVSRNEIKSRLVQELVVKYGFEKKFMVKEIIEEKIRRTSASELFSYAYLKETIEDQINQIVIKKSGKDRNNKNIKMLNGKLILSSNLKEIQRISKKKDAKKNNKLKSVLINEFTKNYRVPPKKDKRKSTVSKNLEKKGYLYMHEIKESLGSGKLY